MKFNKHIAMFCAAIFAVNAGICSVCADDENIVGSDEYIEETFDSDIVDEVTESEVKNSEEVVNEESIEDEETVTEGNQITEETIVDGTPDFEEKESDVEKETSVDGNQTEESEKLTDETKENNALENQTEESEKLTDKTKENNIPENQTTVPNTADKSDAEEKQNSVADKIDEADRTAQQTDKTATEKTQKESSNTESVSVSITRPYFNAITDYEDNPFVDCQSGWYKDPVSFAYANGIIKGHDDTHFDPDGNVTRDQLAVILYRIENGNSDATEGANWAKAAEAWVIETGIMGDFIDSETALFGGSEWLTREQVISTIFRAYTLHNSATERDDFERCVDAGKISDNMRDALRWGVAVGIIQGSVTSNGDRWLVPRNNVTRAEAVTFLYRYLTQLSFADITEKSTKVTDVSTVAAEKTVEEVSEETAAETDKTANTISDKTENSIDNAEADSLEYNHVDIPENVANKEALVKEEVEVNEAESEKEVAEEEVPEEEVPEEV